ncbi:AAA family ATPase [Mesorhizobium sp. CA13]|uniref:AAA family ATPase n=1 Tax=Mesorhizobium sp. CA13 TaxID=2876643 RepID=UPI001CCCE531|nr:AAA family ATPase [Mesorhizobium sp. CA13]MBZ9857981.1 AAA family ATPase [Mesorhizobium sp. CA13]
MSAAPFVDLNALATHFRTELAPPPPQVAKKFILLYAYNGTGKTRLCTAFKDIGKQAGQADTLYFNAFTEDLFSWHNDLTGDRDRYLILHPSSNFFAGLDELEMDNRIRPLLQRYADFDFRLDTVPVKDDQGRVVREERIVRFSREVLNGGTTTTVDNIKISRGEENIFIWCFFLAIVQLAMDDDGTGPYNWVKNIYIDDPISSLDEHNAIVVANHLVQLFRETPNKLKTVISTHHILFFNVLSNEIKNLLNTREFPQYCLNRDRNGTGYKLYRQRSDTPFFHHVSSLVELYEAAKSDQIYTHHFNALRSVLEKTAVFHGYGHFSACIKKDSNDADGVLHQRFIDLLSHGKYSLYEPTEMGDETRDYFRIILYGFIKDYPFNPALFPNNPAAATAPATASSTASVMPVARVAKKAQPKSKADPIT